MKLGLKNLDPPTHQEAISCSKAVRNGAPRPPSSTDAVVALERARRYAVAEALMARRIARAA